MWDTYDGHRAGRPGAVTDEQNMLMVRQQVKNGFTYFNTRCAVSGGATERIMFEHLGKEKALRE